MDKLRNTSYSAAQPARCRCRTCPAAAPADDAYASNETIIHFTQSPNPVSRARAPPQHSQLYSNLGETMDQSTTVSGSLGPSTQSKVYRQYVLVVGYGLRTSIACTIPEPSRSISASTATRFNSTNYFSFAFTFLFPFFAFDTPCTIEFRDDICVGNTL